MLIEWKLSFKLSDQVHDEFKEDCWLNLKCKDWDWEVYSSMVVQLLVERCSPWFLESKQKRHQLYEHTTLTSWQSLQLTAWQGTPEAQVMHRRSNQRVQFQERLRQRAD